jgi:hypothetical protein
VTTTELVAEARKRASAFNDAGLRYGVADLLNNLADALAEVTQEMHARELHHFETEQRLAAAEGEP